MPASFVSDRLGWTEEDMEAARRFLRLLRDQGIREYEGPFPLWSSPIKLRLKDAEPPRPPVEPSQAVTVDEPKLAEPLLPTTTVEAAPGVYVDADAFGHEG